jgi:uncharacterized protein (DUF488 family)
VAPCVFTLGYQQRSLEEYVRELITVRIQVLVDVRETAWSRKPGFSKSALQRRLAEAGIAYVHARFAGNPKVIRSRSTTHEECLLGYQHHLDANEEILAEFELHMLTWLEAGLRVCLLCYERHPEDCHRSILLDAWADRRGTPVRIRHIGPNGASSSVCGAR